MIEVHASEIWSAIGGLIAGALGGSFLTLRIMRNKATSGGKIIDQSNSRVKGDQVGGSKFGR